MILQNQSVRLPIKLITTLGADATGIIPNDILNGIAQVVKSDGTKTSITLTSNNNWFEVDSTQSAGLYHLVLPMGATNILGPIQYTIYPQATAFTTFIGTTHVVTYPTEITAIKAKTDNLPASPANESTSAAIKAKTDLIGTTSVASKTNVDDGVTSVKGTSNISLTDIGGTGFNPNTHSLKEIATAVASISANGIASAVWNEQVLQHLQAGSVGEALRLVRQALVGHVKLDVLNNRLIIYAEDKTTPLVTMNLKDENGNAAAKLATDRNTP
jgi:hypothetical protein